MPNPTERTPRFKRAIHLAALSVWLPAALAATPSRAVEIGAYSMEVLVDGRPLAEYAARGTTYVEASKGHEFSIRLVNRTGERVGIALSIDGLNSIDARITTAGEGRKWLLDPHETVTIAGWQTGAATARRFFFTTEERSYGAWLGRTGNLGVIAAAVFREKRPVLLSWSRIAEPEARPTLDAAGSAAAEASPPGARSKAAARQEVSDELAATGIGRETRHPVVEVEFAPEASASAQLQVRYEYREALVRLGVLPRPYPTDEPLARREGARGFNTPGFAPDPYR